MDTPRKTPRTDAEEWTNASGARVTASDFARNLEAETQELAEALERLSTLAAIQSDLSCHELGRTALGNARAALAAHKAKQPK